MAAYDYATETSIAMENPHLQQENTSSFMADFPASRVSLRGVYYVMLWGVPCDAVFHVQKLRPGGLEDVLCWHPCNLMSWMRSLRILVCLRGCCNQKTDLHRTNSYIFL